MVSKLLNFIKNIPFLLWLWGKGLTLNKIDALAKEYINSLTLPLQKTCEQFFIGLIGSYGAGKTTIAKKIADKLPFVIITSDDGRRLFEQKGFSPEILKKQKLIFLMGIKIIQELMRRKLNIILDADLREPHFREPLRNVVSLAGYYFVLLHITTPENYTKQRVAERRKYEKAHIYEKTWSNILKNVKKFT